jgi:hypothetical protein
LLSLPCIAIQNNPSETNTNKTLQQLYHSLNSKPIPDMPSRLETISAQFLGKPYLLGALGEGASGDYDQFPLYRTDAFDCETLVDTVLAVAFTNNPGQFKHCINQVRYREGHVSFIDRNHFTCLDWNQNNQRQGFIKDITATIRNQHNQPVVKFADALVNKPSWYAHMTTKNIRLNNASPTKQAQRLQALKREGSQLATKVSTTPYIPFTALFDKSGNANQYLFKQIPNAAIVEIIRPNWDLTKEIGTHLNVSHLGFVFWKKGTLIFRQASSNYNAVVDVPLIEYLRNALKSPTIRGINIQVVLPRFCNSTYI